MQSRRWVSLGGWCGPSLILSKLNKRAPDDAMPFDMVRCSMDGVIHFAKVGFEKGGFFPHAGPPPFPMDPVSIWLLFRGQHTCFTHFDLNNPAVLSMFGQRFQAWESMIKRSTQPVTFLRTSIAQEPLAEVGLLPLWEETLDEVSGGTLDFRTILAVHQQGPETAMIAQPTTRSCVWNIAHDADVASDASLFDKTERGYRAIVESQENGMPWRLDTVPTEPSLTHAKSYTELCTVEGIPALRGSCKGIGTTMSVAVGRCIFCGDRTGHAVQDVTAFDSKRPWTEEDDAELLTALATRQDVVAAVEAVCVAQKRGANETWARLKSMTTLDSPTK